MPKYDVEDLLDTVRQIMEAGLNTKIAAIEAEKITKGKGLSPTLAPVAEYHEQTWDDSILQKSPCVFFGVEDVTAIDGGTGAVAKPYKIFCEIVYCDNGQYNDGWKRIHRYSRALEELFSGVFHQAVGSTVKIEQVRPISFKNEMNTSEDVKVGGVALSVTLV